MNQKTTRLSIVTFLVLASLIFSVLPAQAAARQAGLQQEATGDPSATETVAAPAVTPSPGATDVASLQEPTANPTPAYRPMVTLESYSLDPNPIKPGNNFVLRVNLHNGGHEGAFAFNVVVTFGTTSFTPVSGGGVQSVSEIDAGQTVTVEQEFSTSINLWYQSAVTEDITVSYTDWNGTPYTETFTIGINMPSYTGGGSVSATATPTAIKRPQLVISSYETDVDLLQPGTQFALKLDVRNLGTANANSVTMIMGGGSAGTSINGTPVPGGVDGSGGEFTNFAPLKSSNIQFVGEIDSGQSAQAEQPLIVNVSTTPGAYSVKFSFIYTDDKGASYTDTQVITLLVYSMPNVEIGFYQDPGMFMAGQMSMLPVQITNMGKSSIILGTLTISVAGSAQVMNGTSMIGAIEPGGYFPIDAQLIPDQPGPLEIIYTVTYTDDFNQPRTITKSTTVDVMEAMVVEPPITDPSMGEGMVEPGMEGVVDVSSGPETFLQKVVRFVKGLIGLDSSVEQTTAGMNGEIIDGTYESLPEGSASSSSTGTVIQAPLKSP